MKTIKADDQLINLPDPLPDSPPEPTPEPAHRPEPEPTEII